MARDRLFFGWLAANGVRVFERLAVVNEEFSGRYADGWIGPICREQVFVPEDGEKIVITATHHPQPTHGEITIQLIINGKLQDSRVVKEHTCFSLTADVELYRGTLVSVEIRTNSCFVPSELFGGDDKRQLSLCLVNIVIDKSLVGTA